MDGRSEKEKKQSKRQLCKLPYTRAVGRTLMVLYVY